MNRSSLFKLSASFLSVSLTTSLLTGCVGAPPERSMQTAYHDTPKNYVPASRAPVSSNATSSSHADTMQGASATLVSSNPAESSDIEKAFTDYLKTSQPKTIKGQGFMTIPYDAYKRPVLYCAPLMSCNIYLQKGETVNGAALGDNLRWKLDQIQGPDDRVLIVFKPTSANIATNLTIATNKRIYQFGLISKVDAVPVSVSFWYPHDMQLALSAKKAKAKASADQTLATTNKPYVAVNQMNFGYTLSGDQPSWSPTEVFDDGTKTYIKLPPMTDRTNLPVLYVYRNHQMAMINYRYHRPYIIVDGLFAKAELMDGKGSNKSAVDIINHSMGS